MLELIAAHACNGGEQRFYRHVSQTIGLPMRFAAYLPPQAAQGRVPALFYLAGLTCTEETFSIKAGAQRFAAQHGVALIAPDTSPRGADVPGENESWEVGVGAGFYVDATATPWAAHYRMYSYVVEELRAAVTTELPIDGARLGIFGHSMGGHGALVLALRNPEVYRSVSAFAPIAAPLRCRWGQQAFSTYFGDNSSLGKKYDASELIAHAGAAQFSNGILIDQGLADPYLAEQLQLDVFEAACQRVGQPLSVRRHPGYDHGYYFISTFIEDHIAYHAQALSR